MLCAGGRQGTGGVRPLTRIYLVGRAQACELGARGPECRDHLVTVGKSVVACCVDAPGCEEILGKGCARSEIGGRAEIGEEDFGPRPGAREHLIGGVAQLFEWLGEPNARQGFEGRRGWWRRPPRRHVEY